MNGWFHFKVKKFSLVRSLVTSKEAFVYDITGHLLIRVIGCDGGGSDGALDLKGLNPPGRKLVCINNGVDT